MNDNLKTNIEEQLHAEMQRLKKAIEYIEQANLNLKKQDELYQVVVASNQEYKEKIINLEKTLNSLFENTKKEEILAISEVVKKEYNDQTKLNLERYEELFQLAAAENKEYKGKIIDLENTLNGIIQNINKNEIALIKNEQLAINNRLGEISIGFSENRNKILAISKTYKDELYHNAFTLRLKVEGAITEHEKQILPIKNNISVLGKKIDNINPTLNLLEKRLMDIIQNNQMKHSSDIIGMNNSLKKVKSFTILISIVLVITLIISVISILN